MSICTLGTSSSLLSSAVTGGRCSSLRFERSLVQSAASYGATSTPPGTARGGGSGGALATTSGGAATATAPSYLGYLSGTFNNIIAKGQEALSLTFGSRDKEDTMALVKARARQAIREQSKRVTRTEVTTRTRALLKKLLAAESTSSKLVRIQEISQHILSYPPTRVIAAQEARVISELLNMLESTTVEASLKAEARKCLTLCGYQPPVKSRGINLLTIDGGGTRGMMGLEVLERLEQVSGKKICDLFDHVVGVSTGAIIAVLLGWKRYSVQEAREIYMEISRKLFSRGKFEGITGVIMSHSYYNSTMWVEILKELIGENELLIDSAKQPGVPRISVVGSIVNMAPLQPYIFRNYELPAGRDSHYRGSAAHPFWQAIQASSAAPLYFEEVQIGSILLQDGGVIANNPTAIGIHETRLLWPREELHCLVSVGNGRSVVNLEPTAVKQRAMSTNLPQKLNRIIDSATDTEAVHMSMHDLINEKVYFRLNPYMTYPYGLDEIEPERLQQMQRDAELYVRRNASKIDEAAMRLCEKPTIAQTVARRLETWKHRNSLYSPN